MSEQRPTADPGNESGLFLWKGQSAVRAPSFKETLRPRWKIAALAGWATAAVLAAAMIVAVAMTVKEQNTTLTEAKPAAVAPPSTGLADTVIPAISESRVTLTDYARLNDDFQRWLTARQAITIAPEASRPARLQHHGKRRHIPSYSSSAEAPPGENSCPPSVCFPWNR